MRAARCLSLIALALALAAPAGADTLPSKEFNDLKRNAQRAAAAGQFSELAGFLGQLARDDSERAAELIAQLAVQVPDGAVYEAAKRALAGMQSPDVMKVMTEALGGRSGSPAVKILYIDACAERSDSESAAALGAALGQRHDVVIRAAIQAITRRKALEAVDGLIDLLERGEKSRDSEGLAVSMARDALTELTGETFANAHDWRNFWEPRKNSFRPRPRTGDARPAAGGTSERARPTFFGSELKSNRLVFVIDVSGSMEAADPPVTGGGLGPSRGPQTGGGGTSSGPGAGAGGPGAGGGAPESRVRIERAKQQLAQAVGSLPGDARFTILAYSGGVVSDASGNPQMGSEDQLLPPTVGGFEWLRIWKPSLQQASDRVKGEAQQWISGLQANGATFTYNALRHAFEVEGADTIVLLSDGAPTEVDRKTGSSLSTDEILVRVAGLNRYKRLRIDTFGFDQAGGGLGAFMQKLAEQNGGAYTTIR